MKKVINITLGSIVFAIEQDAYDKLALYIEQVKNNLTDTDDAQEIIDDIESAIAEKFVARKRSEKLAVTSLDVDTVIHEMGSPVEFSEDEHSGESEQLEPVQKEAGAEPKKRLYRDLDDAVIAGVASGLARYFDIDPVIVRLIFVVAVFFNGLGLLVYIVLWLVVPIAETTADKYAMRGERVTLRDISERVKKNIENIDSLDYTKTKGVWQSLRNFLDKSFQVIGVLVKFIVTALRYIVGVALVIGGALSMAGIISVYCVILLSQRVFFPQEVQMALEILQSSTLGIIAMVSSFVMMLIPFLVLIVTGASLLAKKNFFSVQKVVTLAVVWIIAIVVAGTTSALQVEQVMQKISPIEGRFNDSSFEVEWENGELYSDGHNIRLHYDVTGESEMSVEPAATTSVE